MSDVLFNFLCVASSIFAILAFWATSLEIYYQHPPDYLWGILLISLVAGVFSWKWASSVRVENSTAVWILSFAFPILVGMMVALPTYISSAKDSAGNRSESKKLQARVDHGEHSVACELVALSSDLRQENMVVCRNYVESLTTPEDKIKNLNVFREGGGQFRSDLHGVDTLSTTDRNPLGLSDENRIWIVEQLLLNFMKAFPKIETAEQYSQLTELLFESWSFLRPAAGQLNPDLKISLIDYVKNNQKNAPAPFGVQLEDWIHNRQND